ncbi:hypothetical protein [Streptomyces sp. NPDC048057]|uniref:hypothetical protein n=1 Tax=Streptomyces sp. NPDC048057 TaxID=3155628 RepID=UPI0033C8C1A9
MSQHTPAPVRVCSNCDGFPVVTITTGNRRHDGTRATLQATCPTCNGTGATPAPRQAVARV